MTSSFIWGSTWLAIKFQLGIVDPMVSVVYRFLIAALILLAFSALTSRKLKYTLKEHLYMYLLGSLLFGLNYWLVYVAELTLPSGLVAVVFSSIIFLNIINGTIFLKVKVRIYVLVGAIVGMLGIILVFNQEILHFDISSENSMAFLLAVIAAALASFGNITSGYIQKMKIPVIESNAFGMMYGALNMFIVSVMVGKPFIFDVSPAYILSLLYLAVFGSIIAFGCYLTLLGNIGADKSAYVTLIIPVIALFLSTLFEGYIWSLPAVLGVLLILTGNIIILRKRSRHSP